MDIRKSKSKLLFTTVSLLAASVALATMVAIYIVRHNSSRDSSFSNSVSIKSISPSSSPVNTKITITGSGFTDSNYIEIAGGYYPAGASTAHGTVITFSLPTQFEDDSSCFGPPFSKNQSSTHCDTIREIFIYPGSYTLTVLTSHGTSNKISFTVTQ